MKFHWPPNVQGWIICQNVFAVSEGVNTPVKRSTIRTGHKRVPGAFGGDFISVLQVLAVQHDSALTPLFNHW